MLQDSERVVTGARFHPHLHAIVSGGSWDSSGDWSAVFGWDRPVLRELFQVEVFRFLREWELLSSERIELIRSWRHSGFDVFVGKPITPDDRRALEHVARYLLRAPVVTSPTSASGRYSTAGPMRMLRSCAAGSGGPS